MTIICPVLTVCCPHGENDQIQYGTHIEMFQLVLVISFKNHCNISISWSTWISYSIFAPENNNNFKI